MRTSMTFQIELLDFERDEWHKLLVTPGDYIRMSKWTDENMAGHEDGSLKNLRINYATAWFALRRAGRLAEFGLPDELDVSVLDGMADRMSVYVDEYRQEGIADPLPEGAPTS